MGGKERAPAGARSMPKMKLCLVLGTAEVFGRKLFLDKALYEKRETEKRVE